MTTIHLLSGMLFLYFMTSSDQPAVQPALEGYQIGDFAADFKLENTDGRMISLSDFEDAKGYLVIFTCNTCPYAVAYEDRINALDKKYKSLGVPVIAINPNNPESNPAENDGAMRTRAEEKDFSFPYLRDKDQKVYPVYGAQRTPHVFLLQKKPEGNKVQYIGSIDDNYANPDQVEERYVENAVDAMLAGREIEVKTTRAIGCSIK